MRIALGRLFSRTNFLVLIVLMVVGLAYLAGFVTSEHNLFPQSYLAKAEAKIFKVIDSFLPKPAPSAPIPEEQSIETIFQSIDVKSFPVPVLRGGEGGGLTSFGNELILMSHEGTIFLVLDDHVERTAIVAPNNGFNEYKVAAQSEQYKGMSHKFPWFRYNDILYYKAEDSQALVTSYTEWIPDKQCYGNTVARLKLQSTIRSVLDVSAGEDDWDIVYRSQPCLKLKWKPAALEGLQAGGRIAHLAGSKIVLSNGDYAWDGVYAPDALSQEIDNDYGKVVEIDVDDGTSRTISIGHRNAQGIVVDTAGEIWVVEHGVRGGDELNHVEQGANYGWPKETLGTRYNRLPWPGAESYGRHDNYEAPIYAWLPSIGTSGLTQIQGFAPSWDGDLLISTLRMQMLLRLRIQRNSVAFAEPIEIGERIRYVQQHSDGRIALWTDSHKIMWISLGTESFTQSNIIETIAESDLDIDKKERLTTTLERCAECHSFEDNVHGGAPGLGAMFGSRIASTNFDGYSDALKSMNKDWTQKELSEFLRDPQAYAPGTKMPNPEIEDEYLIAGIIDVLMAISTDVN